jgi:hypothetical protein
MKNPLGKGLADLARPGDRKTVERMSNGDIVTSSFRRMSETPGHVTYGVWVNGGKCGDLVVRQSEASAFEMMMRRGGFFQSDLPSD